MSQRNVPRALPVREMIEWMVTENDDDEVLERFLTSFPQVMSAELVWEIVRTKYLQVIKTGQRFTREDTIEPTERVGKFLWRWIKLEFTRDFLHKKEKLLEPLLDLINAMEEKTSNEFKLLMIRSSPRGQKKRYDMMKTRIRSSSMENTQPEETRSRPSLTFDIGIRGKQNGPIDFAKCELLDLDDKEIAEQLTMIEYKIYSKIMDSEFHNVVWKKDVTKSAAKNVNALVERFNVVSYWVATEVVMQTDLKKRLIIIKKFVQIADIMKDLGNYNGLMEIIAGLNCLAVQRLKATWEQVPKPVVELFNQLNYLMEHVNNYINYRNALKVAKQVTIPYLGVYLRDIIFLDEGNPDFCDKEKKVINFEKLQLLGTTFCDVKRFQHNLLPITENKPMQEFLKKLTVLPEEILYKHSLLCENNPGHD